MPRIRTFDEMRERVRCGGGRAKCNTIVRVDVKTIRCYGSTRNLKRTRELVYRRDQTLPVASRFIVRRSFSSPPSHPYLPCVPPPRVFPHRPQGALASLPVMRTPSVFSRTLTRPARQINAPYTWSE